MFKLTNSSFPAEQKIYNRIVAFVEEGKDSYISMKSKLFDVGVDSLMFVEIVVGIENEFGIEFNEEKLNVTEFETIQTLIDYVIDLVARLETEK